MRIFNVKNDIGNMQLIQPTDHSKITLERFRFDCEPKDSAWSEDMLFYIFNPKAKPGNFYKLGVGCLVFDEKVLNLCEMIFEMSGEILPVKVERGPELYVLNILQCMNGLNYEKTEWDYYDDGTKGRILKYSMHKERVINETSLFKIPETSKVDIFCYADVQDRTEDFYHLYHDNNLTGLIFEEIETS